MFHNRVRPSGIRAKTTHLLPFITEIYRQQVPLLDIGIGELSITRPYTHLVLYLYTPSLYLFYILGQVFVCLSIPYTTLSMSQ